MYLATSQCHIYCCPMLTWLSFTRCSFSFWSFCTTLSFWERCSDSLLTSLSDDWKEKEKMAVEIKKNTFKMRYSDAPKQSRITLLWWETTFCDYNVFLLQTQWFQSAGFESESAPWKTIASFHDRNRCHHFISLLQTWKLY